MDGQRRELAKLAGEPGPNMVDWYCDNDVSASTRSRKDRPEYRRLLADAKAGRFSVIVAYSSSRLTRRPRDLEGLLDLAERHQVSYRYATAPAAALAGGASITADRRIGVMKRARRGPRSVVPCYGGQPSARLSRPDNRLLG